MLKKSKMLALSLLLTAFAGSASAADCAAQRYYDKNDAQAYMLFANVPAMTNGSSMYVSSTYVTWGAWGTTYSYPTVLFYCDNGTVWTNYV